MRVSQRDKILRRARLRRKVVTYSAVLLGLAALVLCADGVSLASRIADYIGSRLTAVSTPYGLVQLSFKPDSHGVVVQLKCVSCKINDPAVSRETLPIESAVLTGRYDGLHFAGDAVVGDARAHLDLIWKDYAAHGEVSIPETSIAAIYGILRPIIPEFQKARITGTVAGHGTFKFPGLQFTLQPTIKGFDAAGLFDPDLLRRGAFQYPAKNAHRESVTLHSGEGSKSWLSLDQIGPSLPKAVIAAEDFGFYGHPGYDLSGMQEAAVDNEKSGFMKRGGSTLTQQLAKNLFLTDEKTYGRKLRELLYTVEMERELGKKRILELYLNIAEWGPDIHGAKEAAQVYFNKPAGQLRPEEAAWLASILKSPLRAWNEQYQRDRPRLAEVDRILWRMKGLDESERSAALARGITFVKR